MQGGNMIPVYWICFPCPIPYCERGCGEFQEDEELFPRIKEFHEGHKGWQQTTFKELNNE